MFSKPISTQGTFIAVMLFVLQFIYYQFQSYLAHRILSNFYISATNVPFVNNPANLIMLFHVAIHAAFSIAIIYFLYQNSSSTWFVVYLSIVLVSAYILFNLLGKVTNLFYFNIISTKILFFIASPFKTIFSIPALKLRESDEDDNYSDEISDNVLPPSNPRGKTSLPK